MTEIISLAIAALSIYYGCSRGFRAAQWEHRYREQLKQTDEVLGHNKEWSEWYWHMRDQLREAMRELSLLRAGEIADQVQRDIKAKAEFI